MSVTIKDVAKLAGVSPSTVSRVCNNNPSISKETRDRVQQAMETLGYEAAPAAELPVQPIRSVAVILPPSDQETFENTFYLKAIRGISQVCNQRQIASTIVTGRDYDEILLSVRTLHRSGSVDGFIILYSRRADVITEYLCEQGLLYVIVGKADFLAGQTICTDNDNLMAAREAADYLYSLGHRRIGFIGSKNEYLYAADRHAGYQLSLLQNGLPLRTDYCVIIEDVHAYPQSGLTQLLQLPDRPTAFVVSDDLLALALERACTQLHLRIPEDISIIAFNNSLYAQLASPQLTVVDINAYQLGQEAANLVISHAIDPNLTTTKIIVPHRIVPRASCRTLP